MPSSHLFTCHILGPTFKENKKYYKIPKISYEILYFISCFNPNAIQQGFNQKINNIFNSTKMKTIQFKNMLQFCAIQSKSLKITTCIARTGQKFSRWASIFARATWSNYQSTTYNAGEVGMQWLCIGFTCCRTAPSRAEIMRCPPRHPATTSSLTNEQKVTEDQLLCVLTMDSRSSPINSIILCI